MVSVFILSIITSVVFANETLRAIERIQSFSRCGIVQKRVYTRQGFDYAYGIILLRLGTLGVTSFSLRKRKKNRYEKRHNHQFYSKRTPNCYS